jgi:ABC-type uncharacterized transport system YnjBCD ATPase subunit
LIPRNYDVTPAGNGFLLVDMTSARQRIIAMPAEVKLFSRRNEVMARLASVTESDLQKVSDEKQAENTKRAKKTALRVFNDPKTILLKRQH